MSQFLTILAVSTVVLLAVACVVALPLAVVAIVVAAFVFWIWMLVDAIRNNQLSGWARVGWAVLIWFTHWIGALVYLFVARKGRLTDRQPAMVGP